MHNENEQTVCENCGVLFTALCYDGHRLNALCLHCDPNGNEHCCHEFDEGICLDCGTEYGGQPIPHLPIPTRQLTPRSLFFETLKAQGWVQQPRPNPLIPLHQRIYHAWKTIRDVRLNCLPLHRRISCLLFFAPGRYYLTATILALLVFGAHLSTPPANTIYAATSPTNNHTYSDTDRPPKKQPIKTWDKALTITFHNCRENEKHHISCQFRDSTGDQHWICLMGLTENDMK